MTGVCYCPRWPASPKEVLDEARGGRLPGGDGFGGAGVGPGPGASQRHAARDGGHLRRAGGRHPRRAQGRGEAGPLHPGRPLRARPVGAGPGAGRPEGGRCGRGPGGRREPGHRRRPDRHRGGQRRGRHPQAAAGGRAPSQRSWRGPGPLRRGLRGDHQDGQGGLPRGLEGPGHAGPRAEGRRPGRRMEEGGSRLGQARRRRQVGPRLLAGALAAAFGLAAAWSPEPAPSGGFHFVDVAAKVGLTRVLWSGRPAKDHLLDSAGQGVALLDYDRDGRLDVYLVNGWRLDGSEVLERGRNALYRQRADHTFEDVTDAAGVGGEGEWGAGVAVADYDNDGWPDILVTSFGRNVLYRNLGNGRFTNVAPGLGIETPGWNTAAVFFDADGDGWLDLYITRYIDCTLEDVRKAERTLSWRGLEKVAFGPFGLEGAADRFFRN